MAGPRTLSERIAQAASREFVGRRREIALLRDAAIGAEPPFVVAFVHGPGGVGKSRLLREALDPVAAEARIVALDCGAVEPTPGGLLRSVAAGLGRPEVSPRIGRVADLMSGLGGRVVLAFDAYERFGLLDTWLRRSFLPCLPDGVLTILAGRDRPGPGWTLDPGWRSLTCEIPLPPLDQADAIGMLRARGLGELEAARINRFARGHPLALEVAAAAARDQPGLTVELGPPPAVIGRLLDALVADLPRETLATLDAAAVPRRVTEPILRALLARGSVRDEFERLRPLPFVERTSEGLVMHEMVREVIVADLRERDPEVHALYRRRAWRYFSERARRPRPEALWEVTADLIFLIENPVLRNACFPSGPSGHAVEPSRDVDGAAILAIARAHERPGPLELIERWWTAHPRSFSVARSPSGAVDAFVVLALMSRIDARILTDDPVGRAWVRHAAAVPPAAGDRILTMRRWMGRDSGEMLSEAVGACWLDVKRAYMELRPRLSRLYSVMADPDALAPIFEPLGFAPVGPPVDVGGALHQPVWLDFGEGSVDGWLGRLVGAEIDVAEDAVREAPRRLGLTAREAQVLGLVAAGLSNRGIAERLVITEKTAGHHVSSIFAKLGVHNRALAVRVAVENGICETVG